MSSHYKKVNRIYSPVRKHGWLLVILIAIGGLWYPKLGLLIIPMMVTLAIMGFITGKYWCGNLCPQGSMFDGIFLKLSRNKKIPGFLRSKITISLVFAVFMYELVIRLIKVFSFWGSASFLDKLGFVFVANYLVVGLLGVFFAVVFSPRAWCSFCPMGTFQKLTYKAGRLTGWNKASEKAITMMDNHKCTACSTCARVCPMQLTPYTDLDRHNRFESPECIRCEICAKQCPTGALSLCKPVDRETRIPAA